MEQTKIIGMNRSRNAARCFKASYNEPEQGISQ
jgi:hypothetical protein